MDTDNEPTNNELGIDTTGELSTEHRDDLSPVASVPDTETPENKAKSTKKIRWILPLVLIAIVLIGVGSFIYIKHNAKYIQHLNVGIWAGNYDSTLYPNTDDGTGSVLVSAQIFDGLVQYEDQDKIVPDISSGWSNPSSNTWVFTIKPNIKFHDGNTLTPSDVVYSLNLMKNSSNSYAQTFADTLSSITLDGANQVKVITTQPDPALLNKLAFLYIIDQHLPRGDDASQAGTGPYELKPGTKPTSSLMQLVASKYFNRGTIYTKSVNLYSTSTETTLINGYKDHKFDIAGTIPDKDVKTLKGYQYVEVDDTVYFIALNTNSAPLNNLLVREAFRDAINPATVNLALYGKPTPIGQLIPPSIPGYDSSIPPTVANVAEAKALLAQAGYSKGVDLTLSVTNNTQSIQTIVNDVKQAGINLHVDLQPNFNTWLNNFTGGNAQMTYLGYSSDILDGVDILQTAVETPNYNNPALNNLVNKASVDLNPTTHIQLLQQASKLVSQQVPVVPFNYDTDYYVMDKPYVLHQDLSSEFTSVYFYKVHH